MRIALDGAQTLGIFPPSSYMTDARLTPTGSPTSILVTDKTGLVRHALGHRDTTPRVGTHLFEEEDEPDFSRAQLRATFRQALREGEPATCIESIYGTLFLHAFFPFSGLLSKATNNPLAVVIISRPMPRHVIRFLDDCGIDPCRMTESPSRLDEAIARAPRDSGNAYVLDARGVTLYSEIRELPHEPTDGQHYSVWCVTLPDYAEAIRTAFESASMGVPSAYLMVMGGETLLCSTFPHFGDCDDSATVLLQYAICSTLDEEVRSFLIDEARIPI